MIIKEYEKRYIKLFICSLMLIICNYIVSFATYIPLNTNAEYCDFICENSNSVTISLSLPYLTLDDHIIDGIKYTEPLLEGYQNKLKIGSPAVPITNFSMITHETPEFDITILEKEVEIIDNVLLYPSQPYPLVMDSEKHLKNKNLNFVKNRDVYNSDANYPSSLVGVYNSMEYRGQRLSSFWVSPSQYNPVKKQLVIYKKLKIRITLKGNRLSRIRDRSAALSLLKNNTLNARYLVDTEFSRKIDESDSDDIIIITTNSYKKAADELAAWQRMKGYGVKIVAKSSWTAADVTNTVKEFYNATNPKPGYMVIIGDTPDVPVSKSSPVTDLYYVCFGGANDYVADMGRGRISVSSADEAMSVVKKIINYEKTPSKVESFYQTVIGAAQFQIYIANDIETEAWAFTYCIETSVRHLQEKFGYKPIRLYDAQVNLATGEHANPKYWDPGYVGYLPNNEKKPVPEDIQKPNLTWKATNKDVVDGFNKGGFLLIHYDHGGVSGWGAPPFGSKDVKTLENGDRLPVVYSINCLSGSFHKDCFAEALLRQKNGGAVGVIAATAPTWAQGANGALVKGLVDASFPRNLYEPKKQIQVTPRDTVFILGDIFNHGLIRHGECSPTHIKLHSELYHLFGDPTTKMWSDVPKEISCNHSNEVSLKKLTFKVSNLNLSKGIATIVNKKSGELIGKKVITTNEISIPIKQSTKEGDVVLTITSHNYSPYITTLKAKQNTPIDISKTGHIKQNISIRFGEQSITNFTCHENEKPHITLYNLMGKVIVSHTILNKNKYVNLKSHGLKGKGIYILTISLKKYQLAPKNIFIVR